MERYRKELSNPIFLKLPNGFEWKMCWEKRGEDIWLLNKNWRSFARWLRSGDQLVFKYKGESHFDVIIFDDSALEIDYSNIRYNNADEEEEDDTKHSKVESNVEIKNENQKPLQAVKEEKINLFPHLETKIGKRKINVMDTDAIQQNVSGKLFSFSIACFCFHFLFFVLHGICAFYLCLRWIFVY